MSLYKVQLALLLSFFSIFTAGCICDTNNEGGSPLITPLTKGPGIYAGDQVVGTWEWLKSGQQSDLSVTYTFSDDGTFARRDVRSTSTETYGGTWSKTTDTKYALVYTGRNPGFDSENMYYSKSTQYLSNEVYDTFKKV